MFSREEILRIVNKKMVIKDFGILNILNTQTLKKKYLRQVLKQNCQKICKYNKYVIIEDDVMIFPPKKSFLPVSLIYIDPPYHQYDILDLLLQLIKNDIIEKNTIIIVETHIDDNFKVIEKLKVFEQKSYGKTLLYFIKLLT